MKRLLYLIMVLGATCGAGHALRLPWTWYPDSLITPLTSIPTNKTIVEPNAPAMATRLADGQSYSVSLLGYRSESTGTAKVMGATNIGGA
jgi:hypothetical protein